MEVELNRPQIELHYLNPNKAYCLWGRATGKSNGALSPRILHLMDVMPRAQIGMIAPSYTMAEKQILPNVIGFWQNMMGLQEGEDFVIGKKPPEDWEKPILPVFEYKNVISFSSGTAMPTISLEIDAPGNGFNMQAVVGDEAKFYRMPKLKEALRAIRGCNKEFGHLAEFQSQWFFTDKYGGDIEWMLAKRNLVNQDLVNAIISIQLQIDKLKNEDPINIERINYLSQLIAKARQQCIYVSEASAEQNRHILGDKFFIDQKQDSTAIEYNVAINNADPDNAENSFYPDLGEQHFYTTSHSDVDSNAPLMIACDYQWRISPIVTAQYVQLPGSQTRSLNITYSCHTLHPEGLVEAIDLWCNHYKLHLNKMVYYLFDKTAVGKSPTVKPFFEVVMERLKFNGWRVIPINMGETPKHDDKFKMIGRHLRGESKKLPIKINSAINTDLIRSIKLSRAIKYRDQTSKDKSDEKNLSKPAVKTTHYSDVFDMILYATLELNLVQSNAACSYSTVLL